MDKVLWQLKQVYVRGDPGAFNNKKLSHPRLGDITVDIFEGATAVIGPSGSGKTSLLNLLVQFETPDEGNISTSLPEGKHPLDLFWVPQDAGLWPNYTAMKHLEAVKPPEVPPVHMQEILSSLDIAGRASSYPGGLSRGEKARLSVARALMSGAAVIVMDEPFVSVDSARAGKCWEAVRNELARTGASLVFSTHRPEAVMSEASRVICLNEGCILYSGDVQELYLHPATPELADCLGENNWLEPDEVRLWLGEEEKTPRCYRPERISITPDQNGNAVVDSSRFAGALARVRLRHEKTGRVREFFHRPSGNSLRPGECVLVKALLFLLLLLLGSCGAAQEPAIAISEVHHWQIPPDGPRIPAPRALTAGSDGEVFALDTAGRVLVYNEKGELKRRWNMPESEKGNPEGVCELKDGRIAIADTHYSRVIFFDRNGKELGRLGGEGKGPGRFLYPVAIAQDDAENIYIAEYGGNDRIQKFSREGEFLLSFGGFGTKPGEFQRPSGIVWRDGKIYVSDATNNRVQVFTDDGRFLKILELPGRPLGLRFPYAISLGPDNALYIIEWGEGRVSSISLEGRLLGRYGSSGTGMGQFRTPWGITVTSGKRIIVADTGNRRIVELVQ